MNKLDMESKNIIDEKVEIIKDLFPSVVSDGKIDFDALKQEFSSDIIENSKEKYQMSWPGKNEAKAAANIIINKTLRPLKSKSINFDSTKNVYIEGDNLDVLKLLQESYLNKIKCIYIDPPYNTGNDFIYKDNYSKNVTDELVESGQIDDYGNRLVTNSESNGRYHSDWLSMMYPRLKLARNVLSKDGVIFISIDDNEVDNLKKMCNEIFGEKNYVCSMIWRKKTGSSDTHAIAVVTEYILVYSKDITYSRETYGLNLESYDVNRYKLSDEYEHERGKHYTDNLDRGSLGYVESLDFGIEAPDGTLAYPNGRTQKLNDGWRWTWGKEKVEWGLKNGYITFKKNPNKECGWSVCRKNYLLVDNSGKSFIKGSPYKNLILDILNTQATIDLEKMFGKKIFQYSKPVELIEYFINIVKDDDYYMLDFFSGSATTAHAILNQNAKNNKKIKFIMVQLPEQCEVSSEAYKEGYNTIADIGEERIKRASLKIKEKTKADIDYGFRVFKVDSSNMKDVYYKPNEIDQQSLFDYMSNIKEDRTPEDLLIQVMLDLGLPLDLNIEEKSISNNKVFFVENNSLVACFDDQVNINIVDEICKYNPMKVVFKDTSFKTDKDKINLEERIKKLSPDTEVSVL